eukprot:6207403-Pleurochrysis_carterae.AAC.7
MQNSDSQRSSLRRPLHSIAATGGSNGRGQGSQIKSRRTGWETESNLRGLSASTAFSPTTKNQKDEEGL